MTSVSVYKTDDCQGIEISSKQKRLPEQEKSEKVTVQSKLKIAKNPNFDSTSHRRAAPSALTKTKLLVWLKGKISILFEDQLCNCTHRGPRIVDHDVWSAVQDGSDCFLHQFFQRVRCTVLCISAALQ